VTPVDWVALGLVLLAAVGGAVQGLVWSGLSLAGLLAGAFLGGRLVPLFLTNGTSSRYAPVVALVAAVLFGLYYFNYVHQWVPVDRLNLFPEHEQAG